jgi:hypothetical protein
MPDAVPPFDPGAPQNGAELAAALRRITCEGAHFLGTLPVEQFFAPQGDKWSPAEHVRHLRRSSAPLITAYRLPPWMLQLAFGSARRPSRSFDALRDDYRTALAAGGTAGRFAPSPESPPADRDRRRGEILMAWFVTNARVGTLVQRWREARLDQVLLPHPLLGRITAREMAAFTVYHTVHHLTLIAERAARSLT